MPSRKIAATAAIAGLVLTVFSAFSIVQETAENDLAEADSLFKNGDFAKARSLYERYLKLDRERPLAAKAAYAIGDCYFLDRSLPARTRAQKTIGAYEGAMNRFGEDARAARALYRLGQVKIELGRESEATIDLERSFSQFPDFESRLDLAFLLAETNYKLANYQGAVLPYLAFIRDTADSDIALSARLKLGDSYYNLGEHAKFLEILQDLFISDPKLFDGRPEFAFKWAESLMMTGVFTEAETVLFRLAERYAGHPIYPHVIMRLGDLERKRALKLEDSEEQQQHFLSAVKYYVQLLGYVDSPELVASGTLRIAEIADIARIDLGQVGIENQVDLLERVLDLLEDLDTHALVYTRLARHYLLQGRGKLSLEYYKRVIEDFSGTELSLEIISEYNKVIREMMAVAFDRRDYLAFVDLYLGNGQNLDLTLGERVQLAESFKEIQLYDRAEIVYAEILRYTLNPDIRRHVIVGQAKLQYAKGDYPATRRLIQTLMGFSPTPEEEETAALILLEIYFSLRDLDSLRSFYLERTEEITSPAVRSSILYKLAMLNMRSADTGEAEEYFDLFFKEFGEGVAGEERLFGNLRAGYLAQTDVYYQQGRWRKAADHYQIYIVKFGEDRNIAWPLFQSAHCHERLGENELAEAILQEMIRLYPDHSLVPQARAVISRLQSAANRGGGGGGS